MTNLVQGMLGAGVCAITFAAGITVGVAVAKPASGDTSHEMREIRVVLPDRLKVEGIASDRATCLQWVSDHFTGPTVGQFAMMCAGAKL